MSALAILPVFSHLPALEVGVAAKVGQKRVAAGMVVWESATVLGYIPIVSLIVGLARIIFAAIQHGNATSEAEQGLRNTHIIRGIVEALSLGIFLLPMDIFNTCFYIDFKNKLCND